MSRQREKQMRIETANEIIRIISRHGRRFFSMNSDVSKPLPEDENRVSYFYLHNNKLWLRDKYTQKPIYVHYRGSWRYFSDGGTLRRIIEMLRDYITGKTLAVDERHFGPWPEWMCDGDLWAYGKDEMEKVRTEIHKALEITV